jgi:hypothetical protein
LLLARSRCRYLVYAFSRIARRDLDRFGERYTGVQV